jgi:hypothetical protein
MPDPAVADDPAGLIADAYRMDGIGAAECRSIFLDWALRVADPAAASGRLLARHAPDWPDHPMTGLLAAAAGAAPAPGRRRRRV